jgi:hypothetical protein
MHPEDPRAEHLREEKERRFIRLLIIYTVRDVVDLYNWFTTGEYQSRYLYCFGFRNIKPNEKTYNRVSKEIKDWVQSEEFGRFCEKIEFDPQHTRQVIADAFEGKGSDRIKILLKAYEEELALYAFKGPEAGQRDGEFTGKTRLRRARIAGKCA